MALIVREAADDGVHFGAQIRSFLVYFWNYCVAKGFPFFSPKPRRRQIFRKQNETKVMVLFFVLLLAGKKYMIVDCGGGTVDITVHQVIDHHGHCIKELHRASGGPFGSIGNQISM